MLRKSRGARDSFKLASGRGKPGRSERQDLSKRTDLPCPRYLTECSQIGRSKARRVRDVVCNIVSLLSFGTPDYAQMSGGEGWD